MTPERLVLRNAFLTATISRKTGALLELTGPDVANPIRSFGCQWKKDKDLWLEADGLERAMIDPQPQEVTVNFSAEGINVERRYRLTPVSPVLEISVKVTADLVGTSIKELAFPSITFKRDFADAFEDEQDLYFDGEELGGGMELPAWRVFFRQDHQSGLLLVARTRKDMSNVQIYERGFDIKPHIPTAYSTDYEQAASAMTFAYRQEHTNCFAIGPWQAERHEEILAAAKVNVPVNAGTPPPSGKPPKKQPGIIISATEFAADDAVSDSFAPDKWMKVALPFCYSDKVLVCGPSVQPPELHFDPKLNGIYRVYVGVGSSSGIVAQLSNDPMPMFRTMANVETMRTPFHHYLAGEHEAGEILLTTTKLDGQSISLSRFRNSYATTIIDYLRLERLSPEEADLWRSRQTREPSVELSGFNDIPDIARFTGAIDPDPQVYAANLWEHANCRVTKVFWRIDGQCSDFQSKTNTVRYVSAKVHGLFHPQAKAYGRVQKKEDMLKVGVESARKYGLKLYGWMRFNNYGGNVQSDFFKNNPKFHEEWESGHKAAKLCLAIPEVRQHKIDILVEAANYGLDGICLGFLRHPPILCYHPILVEGYRDMYGHRPPRRRSNPDQTSRYHMPPNSDEYTRWFLYRASFMTTFMRDLRLALDDAGHRGMPIAVWVRPNHCLFDGIDLDTWVQEELVQEVVEDTYVTPSLCESTPDWRIMVRRKAKLIRGISWFDYAHAKKMLPTYVRQGYDGVSTYESDFAVLADSFRELYDELRS